MNYPVCECGHVREYHVGEFDCDLDLEYGHPCDYEGCDCMDYIPCSDPEEEP